MEISFLALRLKVICRLLALYFNLKSKFIFALTSLKERNITLRYIITSIGLFAVRQKSSGVAKIPVASPLMSGCIFALYSGEALAQSRFFFGFRSGNSAYRASNSFCINSLSSMFSTSNISFAPS